MWVPFPGWGEQGAGLGSEARTQSLEMKGKGVLGRGRPGPLFLDAEHRGPRRKGPRGAEKVGEAEDADTESIRCLMDEGPPCPMLSQTGGDRRTAGAGGVPLEARPPREEKGELTKSGGGGHWLHNVPGRWLREGRRSKGGGSWGCLNPAAQAVGTNRPGGPDSTRLFSERVLQGWLLPGLPSPSVSLVLISPRTSRRSGHCRGSTNVNG